MYKDRARRVIVMEYEVGPAGELLFLPEYSGDLSLFTIVTPSGEAVADGAPAGTVAEREAVSGLQFRIPDPEAGTWSMEFPYEQGTFGDLGFEGLPAKVRVVELSAPLESPSAILDVRGEGLDVTFDASASRDPDGEVVNVLAWSFGDGCHASGLEVRHTYDEPGTFLVVFEVQDDDGVVGFGFADVTVGDGSPTMASPSVAPVSSP